MQGRIDALRLLFAARQEEGLNALIDIGLLIAIETAGDAAPEDPPVDLALHLIAMHQARCVDTARLLDAEIVSGISEAGAQTEPGEIEPPHFERRTLLPPIRCGQKRVGHL